MSRSDHIFIKRQIQRCLLLKIYGKFVRTFLIVNNLLRVEKESKKKSDKILNRCQDCRQNEDDKIINYAKQTIIPSLPCPVPPFRCGNSLTNSVVWSRLKYLISSHPRKGVATEKENEKRKNQYNCFPRQRFSSSFPLIYGLDAIIRLELVSLERNFYILAVAYCSVAATTCKWN